jgi:hypothetical protein
MFKPKKLYLCSKDCYSFFQKNAIDNQQDNKKVTFFFVVQATFWAKKLSCGRKCM